MKKLLLILCLLLTLCLLFAACGKTEEPTDAPEADTAKPTEGLEYELNEDGASYTVVGLGTATEKEIVIPAEYEGKPVTKIGEDAFAGYEDLTSFVIPEGVTRIEDGAFNECIGLTKITIPASVTYIGVEAFDYCYKLRSVDLAENSQLKTICYAAFRDCISLLSVTIPEGVTSIEEGAFEGGGFVEVYNLSALNIENTGLNIARCIHTSASEESHLFTDGDGYVFYKNGIEWQLIGYTGSDTALTLPENCHGSDYEIDDFAFALYDEITSVIIPTGVTDIGYEAFFRCTALTSITISDSVTSIGNEAFWHCTNLSTITVEDGNTIYHSSGNCLIETASKTLIAGCKNSVIPTDGSVTSIGYEAFYSCDNLTSITIPESVTSIGSSAFENCTGLTSIMIPASVTNIGVRAFENCSGLITVSFGANSQLTSIGSSAFKNCTGLTSITIPDGVTSIGEHAFSGCTKLIQTENGVQYVDKWAIGCDDGITSVTLRADTVGIGYRAFYQRFGLITVTIPAGVASICEDAFYGCANLADIYFGGTQAQWEQITADDYSNLLPDTTIHYTN